MLKVQSIIAIKILIAIKLYLSFIKLATVSTSHSARLHFNTIIVSSDTVWRRY